MSNATVSTASALRKVQPYAAGVGCSTFGRLPTDATEAAAERTLDVRQFRIPVRWNGSAIVSSASGNNNMPIESTIRTYYSWANVRMELVVAGRNGDWAGYVNGDAGHIAQRLEAIGCTDLSRFDFSGPNEPDQNGANGMGDVANRCIQIFNDLQAVGAQNKVWGPVWSNPGGDFHSFATTLGAARLGGINWHSYPGGAGIKDRNTDQVLADAANHYAVVDRVRQMLASNNLPQNIAIDELNWSWAHGDSPQLFTVANTVMLALAYCSILSAGGRALSYATQNGDLSVLADPSRPGGRDVSTPMPAYWGIAALTGAGLFSHYKDTFYPVSGQSDAAVHTFAVNNEAGGVNIICINVDQANTKSHAVAVDFASTGDVWQTQSNAPYAGYHKIASAQAVKGSVSLSLPPLSVTVISTKDTGSTPVVPPPVVPAQPVSTITPAETWNINAGGTTAGWSSNTGLVTGGTDASNTGATVAPAGVPAAVFTTEHWGNQTWIIPVVSTGEHDVTIWLVEHFAPAQHVGGRTFDVDVNGQVIRAWDAWAATGGKAGVPASLVIRALPVHGELVVKLTGVVGSPTLNALQVTLPAVQPVIIAAGSYIGQGASSGWISTVQRLLVKNGAVLPVDGVYGTTTAAAVTAFQNTHGLLPTGVVDEQTLEKLIG